MKNICSVKSDEVLRETLGPDFQKTTLCYEKFCSVKSDEVLRGTLGPDFQYTTLHYEKIVCCKIR